MTLPPPHETDTKQGQGHTMTWVDLVAPTVAAAVRAQRGVALLLIAMNLTWFAKSPRNSKSNPPISESQGMNQIEASGAVFRRRARSGRSPARPRAAPPSSSDQRASDRGPRQLPAAAWPLSRWGSLHFSSNGDLQLINGSGVVLWSSKPDGQRITTAALQESGNLLLRSTSANHRGKEASARRSPPDLAPCAAFPTVPVRRREGQTKKSE
ncbi:hypothetical protein E2562_015233 [Oryza meyeriana var. granulata]|uniref:non-specific serine/threonine protein kinase n=1 Tax=Oryza meyeriana var. granulata TaxID=110450 RepID=A0A6G1EX00_9ORYZ|nr:hypothetical protein E2562_015233 [Oryza meyeriana var. granulata]